MVLRSGRVGATVLTVETQEPMTLRASFATAFHALSSNNEQRRHLLELRRVTIDRTC
jgi:hypothetical protein